jgi:hypothetical protein
MEWLFEGFRPAKDVQVIDALLKVHRCMFFGSLELECRKQPSHRKYLG